MFRTRLATIFLAGCMAVTMLCPVDALAKDPDLSFYPAKKWEVTEAATARDGAPTCTVVNQFNNGFVMQFAGTKDGFTNMNIDFRQATFEANKEYEVKYTVPGNMEKVLPTKAFRDSLLVTDLRGQENFSDALRSTGVVDVSIGESNFRLYMTGFGAAMDSFAKCTNSGQMAAASAPEKIAKIPEVKAPEGAMAPPPPVASAPPAALQGEGAESASSAAPIDPAKLRPDSSRERYTEKMAQELKNESQKFKTQEQARDKGIDSPAPAPVAAQDTKSDESSRAQIQAPSVEELVAQPATAEAKDVTPQKSPVQTDMPPRITKSSVTIPAMKLTRNEPIRARVDMTALMEKPREPSMAEQPQKVAAAEPDFMDDRAAEFADIAPSAGAEGKKDSVPESKISAPVMPSDDFVQLRNKIAELEEKLADATKEKEMLDSELKSTLQDAQQERLSVSSDNWNLERATMKFNESELQIKRLGRQLQSQKAQCDMEKKDLEAMLFDPRLTNEQQLAKLSSLEEELDRVKSDLVTQQRTYEERIELLEGQLGTQ